MAERKLPGSFQIQLLALLLAFLGALALLAQAFGQSALLSRKARQLNQAAGLARNAAEVFAGSEDLGQAALLLGGEVEQENRVLAFFDGEGENCPPGEAAYRLEMEQQPQATGAGVLWNCQIRVCGAGDGQELYELTTARYRPGGEGGGL